jgi:oxygen-independent coproporphyrinogen III oxidase
MEMQRSVLDSTLKQTQFFLKALDFPEVDTLFIGGGTPSSLEGELLESFLSRLMEMLPNRPVELTIEANPDSCTNLFLSTIEKAGITRLSLGVQSFQNRYLDYIGRNHGIADLNSHLKWIRGRWKKALNIDMIHDIPGQKLSDVLSDLEKVVALKPEHISHYSLTIEDNTPLKTRIVSDPGHTSITVTDDEVLNGLIEFLHINGYKNYEISNFSLPDHECRHNLHYWHLDPYIGCGPSAVSTLKDRHSGIIRLENPRSCELYLEGKEKMWNIEAEPISGKEFLFEHIMMGLRLKTGLNLHTIKKVFGKDLKPALSRTLEKWPGFFIESKSQLVLQEKGRRVLNTILTDVLDDLEKSEVNPLCIWPVAGT